MHDGKIVSIHYVRESGGPPERVEKIELKANYGIVGDHRSKPDSKRQLTLIDKAVLEDVGRLLGHPVPDGASRRQIVVSGLDLKATIGDLLKIGPVTVKVESDCAPCDLMEACIGPGARQALEGRGGVCCRVSGSGFLGTNDDVHILGK